MLQMRKTGQLRGVVLAAGMLAGITATHAQEAVQWTGFYAGVHAGATLGDNEFNSRFGEVENGTFHSSAAAGGVQAGYDRQMGGIVFGLGGRFTVLENEEVGAVGASVSEVTSGVIGGGIGGSIGGSLGGAACVDCFAASASTTTVTTRIEGFSTKPEWVAAAEGRIGLAYGRLLPFVAGGLVLGRVEDRYAAATLEAVNGAPAVLQRVETVDNGSVQAGYTIGAGLEYAASRHFSLRGDYGFTDLGERRYSFEGSDNEARFQTKLHELRFGTSYRF